MITVRKNVSTIKHTAGY